MRWARVIAAAAPMLRYLAEAAEAGVLVLPAVEAAVVVFTGVAHGELRGVERDLLWRVFQVPVFEQLLAPDGRVMAMECDAHDGLHVLDPGAPLVGFRAFLDNRPCGCGNPQPRLAQLQRLERISDAAAVIGTAA